MARLSNDSAELAPRTSFDGRELRFELPGLEIGVAEYDEGPTGCTVFVFPDGAACSTDVRGGSPGVRGAGYPLVHAICLAGGSLYGLDAAAGGAGRVLAQRGGPAGWGEIPARPAASAFGCGPP